MSCKTMFGAVLVVSSVLHNGRNTQPTENELRSLHLRDVTPDQAREIDRLYSELLAAHPATNN
jgi:hypothetical protein